MKGCSLCGVTTSLLQTLVGHLVSSLCEVEGFRVRNGKWGVNIGNYMGSSICCRMVTGFYCYHSRVWGVLSLLSQCI